MSSRFARKGRDGGSSSVLEGSQTAIIEVRVGAEQAFSPDRAPLLWLKSVAHPTKPEHLLVVKYGGHGVGLGLPGRRLGAGLRLGVGRCLRAVRGGVLRRLLLLPASDLV